MTLAIPPRPEYDLTALARRYTIPGMTEPFLLGCRGFFLDEGTAGVNDRGLYDDAIFLVHENGAIGYNANTDPSRSAPGRAELAPGTWRYKVGIHGLSKPKPQRYKALVQAAPVLVRRDGRESERGWFGINIHRGGNTTTGSEGCQTIPPSLWAEFMADVERVLRAREQTTIAYVLVE